MNKKQMQHRTEQQIVMDYVAEWAGMLKGEYEVLTRQLIEAKEELFPSEERIQSLRKERLKVAGAYSVLARKYSELNAILNSKQTTMDV